VIACGALIVVLVCGTAMVGSAALWLCGLGGGDGAAPAPARRSIGRFVDERAVGPGCAHQLEIVANELMTKRRPPQTRA